MMWNWKRGRMVLVLGVGMVLIAVGSYAKGTKKGTGCRRIPLEKAAAILKIAPGDLQVRCYDQPVSPEKRKNKTYKVPPCRCIFRSKTSILKAISYTVYIYNDPSRARRDFNTMKDNFATVAKVDIIQGLGDEAFWVGDSRFRRLMAYKGNVLVDVSSPRDFELKKRVLRLVLGM